MLWKFAEFLFSAKLFIVRGRCKINFGKLCRRYHNGFSDVLRETFTLYYSVCVCEKRTRERISKSPCGPIKRYIKAQRIQSRASRTERTNAKKYTRISISFHNQFILTLDIISFSRVVNGAPSIGSRSIFAIFPRFRHSLVWSQNFLDSSLATFPERDFPDPPSAC